MRRHKLLAMLAIILLLFNSNTVAAPNEPKLAELQPVTYAEKVDSTRNFAVEFTSKKAEPKQTEPKINASGDSYEITLRVTAYCTACNSGNTVARPNIHPLGRGAVAVKTSQFAYGTKFEIPGYGTGIACDTGGFAVGTIDICLGQRDVCNCGSEWGVKNLKVRVYK